MYIRFFRLLQQKIYTAPTNFLHLLLFFLLAFSFLGYYAIYFPAFEDEIFAYTNLVSRGFFINIIYYPGPNHHVFFDIIACFLSVFQDLFTEKYHILRFISVISLCILGIKSFKYLGNTPSFLQKSVPFFLFFFIFFAQSPLFLMGFLGRGYALQILIGVILIEIFLKYKKAYQYNKKIIFWAVLGFYTIPTFLYIWGGLIIAKLLENIKTLKHYTSIIFLNFWIVFWVILVYSPIFLISGIKAVFSNDWVKPLTYQQFFEGFFLYFYKLFDYLFPIFPVFFGILLGILSIFFIFFIEKSRKILYLSLIFTPFFMIFLQKILPPERVFTYFYVIFLAVFFELLNKFIFFFEHNKSTKKKFILVIFLCFSLFFCFTKNHIKIHFEDSTYHIFAKEFVKKYEANLFLKKQKIKIFVKDFSDKTYLMYEFLKSDKHYLSKIQFLNQAPIKLSPHKKTIVVLENNEIYDF